MFPAPPPQDLTAEIREEVHIKSSESIAGANCSCSLYAHTLRPDLVPLIDASKMQPNSDTPTTTGAVLFFYENSGLHHVALYNKVGDLLYLRESNYTSCRISTRVISINDKRIIGFIN